MSRIKNLWDMALNKDFIRDRLPEAMMRKPLRVSVSEIKRRVDWFCAKCGIPPIITLTQSKCSQKRSCPESH